MQDSWITELRAKNPELNDDDDDTSEKEHFFVTFFINWDWFLFQGNPRIIELSHIFLQ